MKTILITGATGLVGRRLASALEQRGDRVLKLSRKSNPSFLQGDPCVRGDWLNELKNCHAVVHLAGENIFAKRWSNAFMKRILDSRVDSTRLIAETLAQQPKHEDGTIKRFLSASAIGYYGPTGDEPLSETAAAGQDYMGKVCTEWERAADAARQAGVQVVHPRIGIVLDREGGALPNLIPPFRFFMGGPIGRGKQWMSWIHHHDLTNALMFMIDKESLTGAINTTAPQPARNHEFCKQLGIAMRRPSWLPVPPIAIRLALGKVAEALVNGQRVIPERLIQEGFQFRYPGLPEAMASLF